MDNIANTVAGFLFLIIMLLFIFIGIMGLSIVSSALFNTLTGVDVIEEVVKPSVKEFRR